VSRISSALDDRSRTEWSGVRGSALRERAAAASRRADHVTAVALLAARCAPATSTTCCPPASCPSLLLFTSPKFLLHFLVTSLLLTYSLCIYTSFSNDDIFSLEMLAIWHRCNRKALLSSLLLLNHSNHSVYCVENWTFEILHFLVFSFPFCSLIRSIFLLISQSINIFHQIFSRRVKKNHKLDKNCDFLCYTFSEHF